MPSTSGALTSARAPSSERTPALSLFFAADASRASSGAAASAAPATARTTTDRVTIHARFIAATFRIRLEQLSHPIGPPLTAEHAEIAENSFSASSAVDVTLGVDCDYTKYKNALHPDLDINPPRAVPELLRRVAGLVEHGHHQVRQRRVRLEFQVPIAFEPAGGAAGEQDRQVVVRV